MMAGNRLNRQTQLQCFQLYKENAYAFASIEYLATKLVETGILVKRGDQPATREFQEIVDSHYQKFLREAVVSILLYGFVGWGIEEHERYKIPVVLPGTHITVETIMEKGKLLPKFIGRYSVTNRECPFFLMTHEPDLINMNIDSPICKVLTYHLFEVELLQNASKADKKAADTPLVLENTAANNGFWALQGLAEKQNDILDVHRSITSAKNASFEDLSSSMGCEVESRMHCVDETLVRLQENYVKNLNTIGDLDSMQYSKLYEKKKAEPLPRMQLPPHTRVQGVSFPTTRGDLKEILRMNAQRICIAIGVPPELLIKDHHVKLDHAQSLQNVNQKITELRKTLQPILTKALIECTKGDDFVMALLTGDERFSTLPTIEILPPLPPTQELVSLHQQNLLPPSILQTHLSKKYGFDVEEYTEPAAKKPKQSEEDGPRRAERRAEPEAAGTPEEQ
jgi:hypothetical protein